VRSTRRFKRVSGFARDSSGRSGRAGDEPARVGRFVACVAAAVALLCGSAGARQSARPFWINIPECPIELVARPVDSGQAVAIRNRSKYAVRNFALGVVEPLAGKVQVDESEWTAFADYARGGLAPGATQGLERGQQSFVAEDAVSKYVSGEQRIAVVHVTFVDGSEWFVDERPWPGDAARSDEP
jgi:hypothetical protein